MKVTTAAHRNKPSPSASTPKASATMVHRAIPLLIILAVAATYWPVCGHDFVTWDDLENVARNPFLDPPSLAGVGHFWGHAYQYMYIPVTYTLWAGLAAAGWVGTPDAMGISINPYILHAANLLVHVAAAFFAYRLLLLLVRRPWAAFAGAMLFALHPVQVEPIAWVTGMKDVLCGALSLGALWLYVRAVTSWEGEAPAEPGLNRQGNGQLGGSLALPNPPASGKVQAGKPAPQSWRAGTRLEPRPPNGVPAVWYAMATLLFGLALLTKSSAVTVPLAAFLLDRWVIGRPWCAIAKSLALWVVMAVPVMIVAKLSQPASAAIDAGHLWQRPFLAGDALAFYLYKIVFPLHFMMQYHHSPPVVLGHGWVYVEWLVPAIVAVVIYLFRRRAPWAVAAGGLVAAGTLPVLGMVPFRFEHWSLVADRYIYVAMLGPALTASMAVALLASRKVVGVICATILIALAAKSWVQTWCWHDTVTLFEHELALNPDSDAAYQTLAKWYMDHKQFSLAIQYAQAGTEHFPRQAENFVTLGEASLAVGRQRDALQDFHRACQLAPDDPKFEMAHVKLGLLLYATGSKDLALSELRTAIRLDPRDPIAHASLASLLVGVGQRDEAIEQYKAALQIDPNFQPARQGLNHLLNSPR